MFLVTSAVYASDMEKNVKGLIHMEAVKLNHPDFGNLTMSYNAGKTELFQNGKLIQFDKNKGVLTGPKGELIPINLVENYLNTYPDIKPKDRKKIEFGKKLPAGYMFLTVLPIGLVVQGGFIGGILGFLAMSFNLRVVKNDTLSLGKKVLLCVGSTSLATIVLLTASVILKDIINQL